MRKGLLLKFSFILLVLGLIALLSACSLFDDTNNAKENNTSENNSSANEDSDRNNEGKSEGENNTEENTSDENNTENSGGRNGNNKNGNQSGNNEQDAGEIVTSAIVEKTIVPFPKPMDVINYFSSLHIIYVDSEGYEAELIYETKGIEEQEGEDRRKIYVKTYFEDSEVFTNEYEFWISDRRNEAVAGYDYDTNSYIHPADNYIHGMFEDSFHYFMTAFNMFDRNFRQEIKNNNIKLMEEKVEDKNIAGYQAKVYELSGNYGRYDVTEYFITIAEFSDFEFLFISENTVHPTFNMKFEIKEMTIR